MVAIAKTHCLIEWNEPGKPMSVVMMKSVRCLENEDPLTIGVGDVCTVDFKQGAKKFKYSARVLGVGKSLPDNKRVYAKLLTRDYIYMLTSGTKRAMDSLLHQITVERGDGLIVVPGVTRTETNLLRLKFRLQDHSPGRNRRYYKL